MCAQVQRCEGAEAGGTTAPHGEGWMPQAPHGWALPRCQRGRHEAGDGPVGRAGAGAGWDNSMRT